MPIAAVIVTYLLASVSFPYWFARAYGVDLRAVGERKLGAGNLAKSVGLPQGIVGGTLDGAKGFLAIIVARAVGLAALVGQMWPVFHQFDGGRANATGWGFALAADPIAALIMGVPLYLSLLAVRLVRPRPTRLLPLSSLLSFAIFPAVIWEQEGTTPTVVAGLIVLVLILIRRVSAGLRDDLATGAPLARVLANRAMYDRSELQQRGVVAI